MASYVTDTMALIKFLNGQKVINEKIDDIFKKADEGKNIIIIPSVVIFEIGYLFEKNRIPISIQFIKDITNSNNYIEEILKIEIIESAFEIKDIPELHDRLIAGTAKFLNIPILTNDPIIKESSYVTCI